MMREDRTQLIDLLRSSAVKLAAATDGLSDAQARFRPAEDSWSIAQCVEHLALTERSIIGALRAQVASGPAEPERAAEVAGKDQFVVERIPLRLRKAPAPEMFVPPEEPKPLAESLAEFHAVREATVAFAQSTDANLRDYFREHFAIKLLDGHQWLLLVAAHTLRHTAQVEEIKSHAGYPPRTAG